MRLKRKIFNIFAAIVMVFGSMPMTFFNAYAEGENSAGEVPINSKTVTPNGDGTYNITLSVTGKQNSETSVSKANVVVVFDTSNSMEYGTDCTLNNNYNNNSTGQYGLVGSDYIPLYRQNRAWRYGTGGTEYNGDHYRCTSNRLTVAQNATTNLISTLLANNNLEGADSDTVEISLVNFATSVRGTTDWSTSETTLNNAVNGYSVPNSAQGGTNWETALSAAKTLVDNRISSQPDETNYVIFVSDGDPTFRDSQMGANYNTPSSNGGWNSTANKWGSGNSDPNNWNFNAAKAVADEIAASSNTTLYTVGAFGNATVMQNLAGSDKYYDASDQDALEEAFQQIVDQITNALSLTNIKFTDGITALTTAAVSGNPDNFVYTKGGVAWADAPEAEIKTIDGVKTVVWDLGDTTLKDGETATVSFTVWPSQEAYDLLADLNNGRISYDSLTDAQKASIVKDGDSYSLQTNTKWPTLTYSTVETVTVNGVPTTTVSDPTTINIENDGPMPLDTRKLTLEKKWEDDLDPSQREEVNGEVVLNFYKDNSPYEQDIHLTEDNDWKLNDYISVAPGIMISNDSPNYNLLKAGHTEYSFGGKTYIILETGHDYYFEEEDINGHFELTNYVYHPMIVDNELTNVFFTRDASDNITGIEEFKAMDSVSATNTLKGGINIQKKVVDKNGNEIDTNDSFDVTIHLVDADGNPYAYDYRIYYGEKNPEYEDNIVYDDEGNIKYSRSEHIYGNGKINETIYVGDTIRIVNVDSGVQYYVEETEKNGYDTNPVIVYEEAYGVSDPIDATQTEDGYYVVSGNTASSVTVTNKFLDEKTRVDFEKTWYDADGDVLSGENLPGSITIELFKKGADGKVVSTGETEEVTADTDWKGSFIDLPKYDNGEEIVYSIKESAIEGATYDDELEVFFKYDSEENNGQYAVVGRWKVMTLEDYILQNTWTPATESVTGLTSLNIQKIDALTEEPLEGATFELKLKNGTTFTATTNADGEATFSNLDAGEYTLKETGAPEGYRLVSTEPNINITKIKKLNTVDLINLKNFYEYVFSFSTSQVDGYEYDIKSRTFTVENEPISYIDITAAKVWDDDEDRDGLRKNYANYYVAVKNNSGKYVAYEKLALVNKDNYKFTHLPKETINGEEITYEVVEASSCSGSGEAISCIEFTGDDNYTVTVDENGVITNFHEPALYDDTGELTVQKIWDGEGNELVRPITVTVELYANGTRLGEPVVISAATEWKYTFKKLYKYKNGEPIIYTVQESKIGETTFDEGESVIVIYREDAEIENGKWEKVILGNDITNTWTRSMAKSFTIKKTTVGLKAEVLKDLEFTITGPEDFGDKGEMVLKIGEGCTVSGDYEIICTVEGEVPTGVYTVSEKNAEVENFTLTVSGDDDIQKEVDRDDEVVFEITNEYEVNKTTYRVVKVWQDEHNKDGSRPTKLAINLLANGETIETKDLSAENETEEDWGEDLETSDVWEWTFENLPVADENAEEIEYYAEEPLEIEGYEQIDEISGRRTTIFVNMHEPEEDEGYGGLPMTPETGKLTKLIKTDSENSASVNMAISVAMMIGISLVGMAFIFTKREQ